MAVRDKELIINGKAVRSPEQQVYKNMEDIKELQDAIKPEYTTNASLTSSSVSVAIASTNAPAGTTKGWLLSHDGLKFNITGGDDTNLLLEFYADLKGPQGEDGAALNIDDSTTSLTKVWSSSKTNSEIAAKIENSFGSIAATNKTYSQNIISNLISSGFAFTFTEPVDNELSIINIYLDGNSADNPTVGGPKLKKGDLVLYIDANLRASSLYYITGIVNATAYTYKACDFLQGKQLYQHNIRFYYQYEGTYIYYYLTIKNDSNTPFTIASIEQWLQDKGFTDANNSVYNLCWGTTSNGAIFGLWTNGTYWYCKSRTGSNNGQSKTGMHMIEDKVIPL